MEIYNTTWWGNAIDTAITAGTEPDFFGSQMKMLTSQQPELVVNGDFATDSDWIKGTGWTISGGTANCDGTQTSNTRLEQNSVFPSGKIYEIQLEVTSYTSGILKVSLHSVWSANITSVGTYTFLIDAITDWLRIDGDANFVGSIDNVSVTLARAEEVEAVKCLADWIHTTALQDLNN